jgi:chemotaxis protein histidine kinase CheA
VELHGPAEAATHLDRMEEVVKQMEQGKMSRPEALAELGRLADALREAHQELSRKEASAKNLFQARGSGESKGLADALARKDFQAAAEELRKLAERAQAQKQQSQEELAKLKEQLKALAEKLKEKGAQDVANQAKELAEKAGSGKLSPEDLAKLREELAKLAQQLGDRDLAALADQLKKASDQLATCTQCQAGLDQLQRGLSTLAKAFPDTSGLKDALLRLSDQISEGDAEGLASALRDSLAQFDAQGDLEGQLALLSACAGLCDKGGQGLAGRRATWGGTGIYSPGDSRKEGPGMGGPGIGTGGVAPISPEDVALQPTKVKGQVKPGRVVGGYFTDGFQLKGDAQAEYRETVGAAAQDAADAIEKDEIPRAYSQSVRKYFEEMRKE